MSWSETRSEVEDNGMNESSERKSNAFAVTAAIAVAVCLVLVVLGSALVVNVSATSRTRTVYIQVSHVKALDPMDVGKGADFYLEAIVNGVKKSTSVYMTNTNEIWPGWLLSFSVTYDTATPDKSVIISIRDKDAFGSDQADTSKRIGKNPTELSLNLETGVWNGDDRFLGDLIPGYTSGEEMPDGSSGTDQDDAQVWFNITRGA